MHEGFLHFLFGPPYPKFHEEGRRALADAAAAQKAGKTYRDAIGQCWPPGMPMIMTRVWPHAFIQLPTAIYMISGFNNSFRTIYLDGRKHSDPDLVVPSYNGESIGHWEGQTLVVDTRYFETENHYIDYGIPISEDFAMTERIRLLDGGKTMEIAYTMTDPQMWDGEWKSTKRFMRADFTDVGEIAVHPAIQRTLARNRARQRDCRRPRQERTRRKPQWQVGYAGPQLRSRRWLWPRRQARITASRCSTRRRS